MFLARFAELLHSETLRPDGSVDENLLKSLQQLRQRHDAHQKQDPRSAALMNKNVNLFLAKLYLQCGRTEESQQLLNEQFQRGIEILRDDGDWNDSIGFHILSKILFLSGRKSEANIAQSLRRFTRYDPDRQKNAIIDDKVDGAGNLEDVDPMNKPANILRRYSAGGYRCSKWLDCPNHDKITPGWILYTCMTCVDVNFCESCYNQRISSNRTEKAPSLYVCHPEHEHVKTPLEDWVFKDDIMTIGGKEVPVGSWLEATEKDWNSGYKA